MDWVKKKRKVKGFLFLAALLILTTFVQNEVEAFGGVLPPGRRELSTKVSIVGKI